MVAVKGMLAIIKERKPLVFILRIQKQKEVISVKDLYALLSYQGINPCPSDFTEYWQRALAELDSQPLEYELEPESALPGAERYHLWFSGVGGARIHAKLVKPKAAGTSFPAIALFHGYSDNCGDWFSKLPWVSSGFVCAAMDVRGQGGLSTDPLCTQGNTHRGHIVRGALDEKPEALFYRNVFLDTVQLMRILAKLPYVDETRLGAYGSSQGGALTVACAALEPRVRAIAIGCPFLSDYKGVWALDAPMQPEAAYRELYLHFRKKDPLHEHEDEFWKRLGYIDVHHLAQWVKADSLFFSGLQDITCPPESQFAVYNHLAGEKQLCVYPECGHEIFPEQDDRAMEFFIRKLNNLNPAFHKKTK